MHRFFLSSSFLTHNCQIPELPNTAAVYPKQPRAHMRQTWQDSAPAYTNVPLFSKDEPEEEVGYLAPVIDQLNTLIEEGLVLNSGHKVNVVMGPLIMDTRGKVQDASAITSHSKFFLCGNSWHILLELQKNSFSHVSVVDFLFAGKQLSLPKLGTLILFSRAGHFRYFFIFSIIKNDVFALFMKLITYFCTSPA